MSPLWCIEYSGLLYFWKLCASLCIFDSNISSASCTIFTLPHLGSWGRVRWNRVWWVKVTVTLKTAILCTGHLKLFTTIHLSERLKVNYNCLRHGQSDNNNWTQLVLEKSCSVGHTACICYLKNHNVLLRSLIYGLKFIICYFLLFFLFSFHLFFILSILLPFAYFSILYCSSFLVGLSLSRTLQSKI